MDPVIYGLQGTEARIQANATINEEHGEEQWLEWITAPCLLSVHRMLLRGSQEDWWGIRYHEGMWYPIRYRSEEEARAARDETLLDWLNSVECMLVLSFRETKEQGDGQENVSK